MATIGYAWTSICEVEQVLDRQKAAFKAAGCERVFEDRATSAGADRPGLQACLDYLGPGDILVVVNLERLGRPAGQLIRFLNGLESRRIGFRALNSAFDTTSPAGRSFFEIQATIAKMERNVVRQRVSEGIAAARAQGRNGGRPRVMTPEKLRDAQQLMADRSRSIPMICREFGNLPVSTL